ncbi:MAG: DUF4143 domain-containing protein, partial [Candidatus Nanoarchaeia archaeon]|nr:DUF4143 domain-containing protein [Candidatus Nanoarchaeia archaeon]
AENIVFLELKRREKEVFYWKETNEVDFILKNKDNSLTAINVTYSDDIKEREKKGIIEFSNKFKDTLKECLILTKNYESEQDGIKYLPIWKWLLC